MLTLEFDTLPVAPDPPLSDLWNGVGEDEYDVDGVHFLIQVQHGVLGVTTWRSADRAADLRQTRPGDVPLGVELLRAAAPSRGILLRDVSGGRLALGALDALQGEDESRETAVVRVSTLIDGEWSEVTEGRSGEAEDYPFPFPITP